MDRPATVSSILLNATTKKKPQEISLLQDSYESGHQLKHRSQDNLFPKLNTHHFLFIDEFAPRLFIRLLVVTPQHQTHFCFFLPFLVTFSSTSALQEMALNSTWSLALGVAFFGTLSFIFGVIAENKKPPFGTAIKGKDVVICKYPSDPTIALGILSILALVVSWVVGHAVVFYPYNGKSVPRETLFRSCSLVVFIFIAELTSALALIFLAWATVTEGLHLSRNVHHNLSTDCPTAKTGLFGGAAFIALDATLFWLVCQMLTLNVRADFLDEDQDAKGHYGQVYGTDCDAISAPNKA
ncbi:keratin-associated protein (DUF1218) [Rhynchospora pubera]|uniref:Keratin-associated protein (DUF1218) n=1 Tax=Rhynchospora pubera TaxID=906938 RepID=A0AAV8EWM1_9POAL|nr:keratin-associated protein (DUF1218) [Rhynchospora pubera]